VSGHLNNLNKELQGKNKLVNDVYDNIKLVHFPHLKSLETTFTECIEEYSHSISLLQEEFDERFWTSKLWNQNFCCMLYL
jgi:hypothetical protein